MTTTPQSTFSTMAVCHNPERQAFTSCMDQMQFGKFDMVGRDRLYGELNNEVVVLRQIGSPLFSHGNGLYGASL